MRSLKNLPSISTMLTISNTVSTATDKYYSGHQVQERDFSIDSTLTRQAPRIYIKTVVQMALCKGNLEIQFLLLREPDLKGLRRARRTHTSC